MVKAKTVIFATAALLMAGSAAAHHSFAAFFDPNKPVKITGTVSEFQFTNPHGLIIMMVKGSDGKQQEWRVETNAPVVLRRRGWTLQSIKVGETITIDGWGSRDGKPYLRLRGASRADGSPIGIPFSQNDG